MIEITAEQLETVLSILNRFVPECEIRVFGSRYKGHTKKYSDLDLAIVGEKKIPWEYICKIKEAFQESDLPFRVDVLDWHTITPEFKKVIEQGYEIIEKKSTDQLYTRES